MVCRISTVGYVLFGKTEPDNLRSVLNGIGDLTVHPLVASDSSKGGSEDFFGVQVRGYKPSPVEGSRIVLEIDLHPAIFHHPGASNLTVAIKHVLLLGAHLGFAEWGYGKTRRGDEKGFEDARIVAVSQFSVKEESRTE
jgi:hypothetical protein